VHRHAVPASELGALGGDGRQLAGDRARARVISSAASSASTKRPTSAATAIWAGTLRPSSAASMSTWT
jgi:hypothetical protein